jgi:UDP-N-acetylglucosamine/UDP-N-acetylgalactosamine diphosphorylase
MLTPFKKSLPSHLLKLYSSILKILLDLLWFRIYNYLREEPLGRSKRGEMSREKIFHLLEKYRQDHILQHSQRLDSEKKNDFLEELKKLDLALAFELHRKFSKDKNSSRSLKNIGAAPVIILPGTPQEKNRREEARVLGESLIRKNQVAVLIVAGGQGSRLGIAGPKGKFPVSPVKKKSLFQLFAESVKSLSLRYGAMIPLFIMTSEENGEETRQFFEFNNYFGLEGDYIYFFEQGRLPTLTREGHLILRDDTHLLVNPDGHGGSLKALHESGLLESLTRKGFSELFFCQVDNPLVKIADPVFIGHHRMEGSEFSTKVVRRRDLEEKVGIYGLVDGKPAVVEYSDFLPEEYRALDEKGSILHWPGNIAVHVISLSFIQRLNLRGFALPYHLAVKDVEVLLPDGKGKKMTGWKFETFVFDAIPFARKTCCLEVLREEEFAPVKNPKGSDSPETARAALSNLHRSWLKEAGAELAPKAQVEISPLCAMDEKELIKKLKGQKLVISEDTYIDDSVVFRYEIASLLSQ